MIVNDLIKSLYTSLNQRGVNFLVTTDSLVMYTQFAINDITSYEGRYWSFMDRECYVPFRGKEKNFSVELPWKILRVSFVMNIKEKNNDFFLKRKSIGLERNEAWYRLHEKTLKLYNTQFDQESFKGDFNPGTTYALGDYVWYSDGIDLIGKNYKCIVATTTNAPGGAEWEDVSDEMGYIVNYIGYPDSVKTVNDTVYLPEIFTSALFNGILSYVTPIYGQAGETRDVTLYQKFQNQLSELAKLDSIQTKELKLNVK